MTDLQGRTHYYKDFAREIDQLHALFMAAGIQRGDKISLCGKNSANWAIAFFATLSYGAVSVSILHEFDKDSVQFIVDHSDSIMLFTDDNIWQDLDERKLPNIESVISLNNFSLLKSSSEAFTQFVSEAPAYFGKKYEKGFFVNDLSFRTEKPEELAVINYTSGTTSSPKGVMIPYRSLWSNTKLANDSLEFIHAGDKIVCMLPMAHTYGLAFEILNSISMGCHIHFLGKTPSPKVLLDAFARVKPKLVLAVPLIIEKIVNKSVLPKLQESAARILTRVPLLNSIVYTKVRKSMIEAFGGNLVQVTIGGAAINPEVEKFLRKVKFPYTVGYGMTECGPLISYSYWTVFKEHSCGRIVDRMQVRIDSEDPRQIVGEIQVRGSNLMLGYYKNEEATRHTFTDDGWLKTGDLGLLDKSTYGTAQDVIDARAYFQFYMHRTGHWLGMDVHDCGSYVEAGELGQSSQRKDPLSGETITNRPSRILRPGMVTTIEPGIYVRPAPGVPEQFHHIGIRIEDDAVVTDGDCELLTRGVPVEPDDIEALMRA